MSTPELDQSSAIEKGFIEKSTKPFSTFIKARLSCPPFVSGKQTVWRVLLKGLRAKMSAL